MIYLDNAATTPLCEAAKKAIINNLDNYGNPSSSYAHGHNALMLIEDSRERIAKCINAEPNEIYFTSGGSEADTWALNGKCSLASSIEHHAIQPTFKFKVTSSGIADLKDIKQMLLSNKIYSPIKVNVVSCMMVNNEIGTIQPIKEIAEIAHEHGVLFHTDAVQSVGHIPIDVKKLNCDMLSASAHKFGGPKGTGFLYVKNGVDIPFLINGGKQEHAKRGGTENTLGIIAMAVALENAVKHIAYNAYNIKSLSDRLSSALLNVDGVYLNGSDIHRMSSNINVRIDGVSGQDFVAMADEFGICCSTGSACQEGIAAPSHVLKAIGLTDKEALSSVRFSLGHQNTLEEINYCCEIIPKIIKQLRAI